ncbi:MAG: hypothetical protein IK116_06525 [Firmicutes bacterium]|nr:hypothetical protein [Bacillota bacterium]
MAAAIICGLLWGGLWGAGKYLLLWRPLFRPGCTPARVGTATTVNLLLDAVVLLVPFLLRSRLPFPAVPCLIAAAAALSAAGRWPVLLRARQARRAEEERAGETGKD